MTYIIGTPSEPEQYAITSQIPKSGLLSKPMKSTTIRRSIFQNDRDWGLFILWLVADLQCGKESL